MPSFRVTASTLTPFQTQSVSLHQSLAEAQRRADRLRAQFAFDSVVIEIVAPKASEPVDLHGNVMQKSMSEERQSAAAALIMLAVSTAVVASALLLK